MSEGRVERVHGILQLNISCLCTYICACACVVKVQYPFLYEKFNTFPNFLQITVFFFQTQSHELNHTPRTKCIHGILETHGNHNELQNFFPLFSDLIFIFTQVWKTSLHISTRIIDSERTLIILTALVAVTYLTNSEVGRPKIVRPLRNTVSFIYASECNLRQLRNRRQTTISRAPSHQGLR